MDIELPPARKGYFRNGRKLPEGHVYSCADLDTASAALDRKLGGRKCQVCLHKDRARIELARVAGRGLDAVAKEFGIHRDSLFRHMRKHVTSATKLNYLAGAVKIDELTNLAASENKSVIEYLSILRSILFGQLDRSAQLNRPFEVEKLGGRALDVLREIGHITGQLSAFTSQNISVTNNTAIVMNSPVIAELQANLMTALAPFPDARKAVISLFLRLDEKHGQPDMKLIEGCANA